VVYSSITSSAVARISQRILGLKRRRPAETLTLLVAPMSEVTRILSAIDQGDSHAAVQPLPLVYMVTHNTANSGYSGEGGGIANLGTMTMTACTVSGSSASYRGGVYKTGLLTATNSTVTQNMVGSVKGGGGADLFNLGTLDVSASTIGRKSYK
jgi:hypothetical protein